MDLLSQSSIVPRHQIADETKHTQSSKKQNKRSIARSFAVDHQIPLTDDSGTCNDSHSDENELNLTSPVNTVLGELLTHRSSSVQLEHQP